MRVRAVLSIDETYMCELVPFGNYDRFRPC